MIVQWSQHRIRPSAPQHIILGRNIVKGYYSDRLVIDNSVNGAAILTLTSSMAVAGGLSWSKGSDTSAAWADNADTAATWTPSTDDTTDWN